MSDASPSPSPAPSPAPSPEETSVREYLLWITDPSQLIDAELVARLEAEAAAETDPIAKLRALSRLEHARAVDGERFKLNFITHAKQWADENQITEAAFRELGVDDTILRAAGIGRGAPASRGRRASSGSRGDGGSSGSSSGSSGPGSPGTAGGSSGSKSSTTIRSVSSAKIKSEVAAWVGEFTLGDVVTKVGGSPMTVRKAVDELVEDGVVHRLGPQRDHNARGRAPIVYRVR